MRSGSLKLFCFCLFSLNCRLAFQERTLGRRWQWFLRHEAAANLVRVTESGGCWHLIDAPSDTLMCFSTQRREGGAVGGATGRDCHMWCRQEIVTILSITGNVSNSGFKCRWNHTRSKAPLNIWVYSVFTVPKHEIMSHFSHRTNFRSWCLINKRTCDTETLLQGRQFRKWHQTTQRYVTIKLNKFR